MRTKLSAISLSDTLLVIGALTLSAGVGLLNIPAAIITFGFITILLSLSLHKAGK